MAQLDEYPNIGSGNLKKETITQNGGTTTYDSENEDDAEAIVAVAGGLGAVKLSSAADYSVADADLAKYSLDETARITVKAVYTENDKKNVLRTYIGSNDGSGNRYVMINDSRIVYLISEGNLRQYFKCRGSSSKIQCNQIGKAYRALAAKFIVI